MERFTGKTILLRLALLVIAAVSPVAFPLSQLGFSSLHRLAVFLIIPSAISLFVAWIIAARGRQFEIASILLRGGVGGALATVALEAIRYPGFRFGFMPGNLPRLMGVLLLDRFALGPSPLSDIVGFSYHFWNGACFGIIYALLATGWRLRWAISYGLAIGVGFLFSPVVQALGVGLFGRDFGWHFAATVLTAHAAFGAALGALLSWMPPSSPDFFSAFFGLGSRRALTKSVLTR